MSNIDLALWSFPILLILIFLRAPIALAMLAVGFSGTYMVTGTTMMTLNQMKTLTYGTFSNYSFSIIPLFLLMGQFATLSGMSAQRGRRDVRHRGLCGLWRDMWFVFGNGGYDGAGSPA